MANRTIEITSFESVLVLGDVVPNLEGQHTAIRLVNLGPGHVYVHGAWVELQSLLSRPDFKEVQLSGDRFLAPGESVEILSRAILEEWAKSLPGGLESAGKVLSHSRKETLVMDVSTASGSSRIVLELSSLIDFTEPNQGPITVRIPEPPRLDPIGLE